MIQRTQDELVIDYGTGWISRMMILLEVMGERAKVSVWILAADNQMMSLDNR